MSSPLQLLHWFLNVFVGVLGLGFEVSALEVGRRGKGIPTAKKIFSPIWLLGIEGK